MSGGISGTGEFNPDLYKIHLEDLEKSGELTPFQVKQDTIETLGGNYFGKLYLAPGSVPFLDQNYEPIFSLEKMTPQMFAWLMIRGELDKISLILDEIIFQATETGETIDLLSLLKAISDAIEELEKQIAEAIELDADQIRARLEDLAKQSEKAYEELHKGQLLLNLPEELLRKLGEILYNGGNLPEEYNYITELFGALLNTYEGKVMLGMMFQEILQMKEKGRALEAQTDRRGGLNTPEQAARDIERISMGIQNFDHLMNLLGLDPKLLTSIITLITQITFKNYLQGNDALEMSVLNLLQDETAIFNMFEFDMNTGRAGAGISDLEKQIIGVMVTMTFTLIYMELQEIAELDGEVSEAEKMVMKAGLALIILNLTSNETFRGIMGKEALDYLQSEDFLNNLIFTARLLHNPEEVKDDMTLTDVEMEEIITMLLENKAEVILELLKNLKMLKAMYEAVLAAIQGGSAGGNILELLKGLKEFMTAQGEIPLEPPEQQV